VLYILRAAVADKARGWHLVAASAVLVICEIHFGASSEWTDGTVLPDSMEWCAEVFFGASLF
jgi:hypothetical protein